MNQGDILFRANWQLVDADDESEPSLTEEEMLSVVREVCRDPGARAVKCDDETLDEIEIGGSRLGGVPDLPIDFEWPRYQGYIVPLIAQLNLADVEEAGGLLPNTGWLYVFGLSGVCDSIVPFVIFHLECAVDELKRCNRPPNDDVWVPERKEIEDLALNMTIPLAVADNAMLEKDDEIYAWLLTSEVVGYGDIYKVAADEGLDGNDWIILFGMKTTYFDTGSMPSDSAEFGDDAALHLLIRVSDLRLQDFSNLHPFLIA